jgi:hypothetical protein
MTDSDSENRLPFGSIDKSDGQKEEIQRPFIAVIAVRCSAEVPLGTAPLGMCTEYTGSCTVCDRDDETLNMLNPR